MALVRRKKSKKTKQATTGGGLAGLLALGGAALLALRRRRKAREAGVFPTQPEVVTGQGEGIAGGPDDLTLARKVESEIFRDDAVPKGAIVVNSEFGVIFLRGEVGSDDLIETLEAAARDVEGVKDVRNLLHRPGTPAPAAA